MAISRNEPWTLSKDDEDQLIDYFKFARKVDPANKDGGDGGRVADTNGADQRDDDSENKDTLTITPQVFREWVEMDRQSPETEGEPGFMDIFLYLGDLRSSLADRDQLPHLTILSGRSTRLAVDPGPRGTPPQDAAAPDPHSQGAPAQVAANPGL